MTEKALKFDGLFLALRYYNTNRIKEAEEEATKLLAKNPLDQVSTIWTFRTIGSYYILILYCCERGK